MPPYILFFLSFNFIFCLGKYLNNIYSLLYIMEPNDMLRKTYACFKLCSIANDLLKDRRGEDYLKLYVRKYYDLKVTSQLNYIKNFVNDGLDEWVLLLQECGIRVTKNELMIALAIKEVVQMEFFDDVEESFIDFLTEMSILLDIDESCYSFERHNYNEKLLSNINNVMANYSIMYVKIIPKNNDEPFLKLCEFGHLNEKIADRVDMIIKNRPNDQSERALLRAGELMTELNITTDVHSGIFYFLIFMMMKDCAKVNVLKTLREKRDVYMKEKERFDEDLMDSRADLRVWFLLLIEFINKYLKLSRNGDDWWNLLPQKN